MRLTWANKLKERWAILAYTNLIDEYKEAGALHRLHITLLFGQITVYLAANAGMFKVAIENQSNGVKLLVSFMGIIMTLVFWIITTRAAKFMEKARDRAKDIEKEIGFELYTKGPSEQQTLLTAVNATLDSTSPV